MLPEGSVKVGSEGNAKLTRGVLVYGVNNGPVP